MIDFKKEVVRYVVPTASGVLLDPEVGAPHAIASDLLPGQVGLIVALEATGYTGNHIARISHILRDWSVGKVRRMGASALKLLIYYHPESSVSTHQEELVEMVGSRCHDLDLAFFLEPLSYSLKDDQGLSSTEKRGVVIETARRLTPLGVDVLKSEFPVDIAKEQNETIWHQACEELSLNISIPWVLLSAGVIFKDFLRQTLIALDAGASGVLAGRAIWGEAIGLDKLERANFLKETASARMKAIRDICNARGQPWTKFYPVDLLESDWYRNYPDLQ
jgi:tagatose-1,6-bisphosphate aldolase